MFTRQLIASGDSEIIPEPIYKIGFAVILQCARK